jgi:hypothetical protein
LYVNAILLSLGITRCPTVSSACSMVTGPDRCNTSVRPTILTVHKLQPCGTILSQLSIRRTAHLASDILHNVFTQQGFNVLRHVLSTNDKTLTSIDTSFSTEFRHEELKYVLRRPLHHGANLLEVNPKSLLRSHPSKLGWLHVTALLLDQIRVVRGNDVHNAIKEVGVRILSLAIVLVGEVGVEFGVLFEKTGLLRGHGGIIGGGIGGLGFLVGFVLVLFGVLLLLGLLLLFGEVEHRGDVGLFVHVGGWFSIRHVLLSCLLLCKDGRVTDEMSDCCLVLASWQRWFLLSLLTCSCTENVYVSSVHFFAYHTP